MTTRLNALKTSKTLRVTMVFFALIDLVYMLPFAVPGFGPTSLELLQEIDTVVNGPNAVFYPSTSCIEKGALFFMFINLAGVIGSLWTFTKILNPTAYLAYVDSFGRILIGLMFLFHYNADAHHITLLVIGLFVFTVTVAIVQTFLALTSR